MALVTPFRDDGSIDVEDLQKHVEFQIENGVGFMVPGGTTGEGVTLSADEQQLLIRSTVEATRGRTPVLAGAGGSDTADVVRKARAAREAGADGVLSVSPAYNKPTQRGLIEHYRAVAGAVDCPVFIYNVPGRTASNVLPETVLTLAETENIAGVKEASGDVDQVMTLIRERPEGFTILSGDDALTFPLLAAGADGVISVVANLAPALMSQMVARALSRRLRGSSGAALPAATVDACHLRRKRIRSRSRPPWRSWGIDRHIFACHSFGRRPRWRTSCGVPWPTRVCWKRTVRSDPSRGG